MAYPSATFYRNRLPTGTAGRGFYDATYPDGDRPVDTYSIGGGITLIVEQGSANGSFMAIELAESVPWRFGPAPTKIACLGFGKGPLYSQSVDSTVNDHIDPITGEQWNFYNTAFVVKDNAGYRYLQGTPGGSIEFDTGISKDDHWVHISSRVQALNGVEQWKSYRMRELEFGSAVGQDQNHINQIYTNQFNGPTEKARIQAPASPGSDSVTALYSTNQLHPKFNDPWSFQALTAYSGTADQSDGLIYGANAKDGSTYEYGGYTTNSPPRDSTVGVPLIGSSDSKRWRRIQDQNFHDNTESSGVTPIFRRSDYIMQCGSPGFLLLSDVNSAAANGNRFALPYLWADNNRKIYSVFWKAEFASLANKYMSYVDSSVQENSLGVVATFQLPAEI